MARLIEFKPGGDPIRESSDDFLARKGDPAAVTLVESSNPPKGTLGIVEGVAGKADIVNRNRRYYSEKVYALAVERAQPLIEQGRFLGEVDHPWVGSLEGAAYRFTKLFMEGDLMKFEGVILDTPSGKVLKGLLEGGVGVAVSTRGYGSIKSEKMDVNGKEQEVGVIQDDYRMEGIDFVLFPSNPHGEVTHHENAETHQETPMDLEQLRTEHPELVEAIEAAAREGFVSQEDHEAALEDARTEARNEVQESDEAVARRDAIAAVVEALRPLVPELAEAATEAEQTETERELESLRGEFATLNERLEAVEQERNDLAAEAEAREARESVEAHVDELLEGYAHADLIRDDLLALESVEAVDEMFEARKGLVESLAARLGVTTDDEGRGAGEADQESLDEDDQTADEVAEDVEKARERLLAGLDS